MNKIFAIIILFVILITTAIVIISINHKKENSVTDIGTIVNNCPNCPPNSFYRQCTNYMWNNLRPTVALFSKTNPKVWEPKCPNGTKDPEWILNNDSRTPRVNIYNSDTDKCKKELNCLFPQK